MDFLWDKITEWLKEMLIGGIASNLSGMFDATNQKVAEISGQVGSSTARSKPFAASFSTSRSPSGREAISTFSALMVGTMAW